MAPHTTGLLPTHEPAMQLSTMVHALPSLQAVPSGLPGLEHMPVAALQVPTSWHASSAVHVMGLLPWQLPAWHVSVWVHASPSLQALPSAFCGLVHSPVPGLQVPTSWQLSVGGHVMAAPPTQVPAWQLSNGVQALPSLHALPSGLAGLEHMPVAGLHVPGSWQASSGVHVTGAPGAHVPDWQVSDWVQLLPSLQEVPLGAA